MKNSKKQIKKLLSKQNYRTSAAICNVAALVLLLVIGLPGCGRIKRVSKTDVTECQARHIDIPVPLDSILQESTDESANGHGHLFVATALPLPELFYFYEKELEYAGWKKNFSVLSSQEFLLFYEKPFKYLAISARQFRKRVKIHYFPQIK